MSEPRRNLRVDDAIASSDSDDSEAWFSAYDSEFDMTLSDVDDDLLEAMRNFDIGGDDPIGDAPQSLADETRYTIANGATTSNWSEAATAQRRGVHVEATLQRQKVYFPKPFLVVVVGTPPGIYVRAEGGHRRVKRMSPVVYQGYPTRETAEVAWQSAQDAGLVGSRDGRLPPNLVLHSLPLASVRVPPPSSLSTPEPGRRFYVVYRGRVTGIFNSSLESGLSVIGVPGNAHESHCSYTVASRKYRSAVDRGEVETVVV